MSLVAGAGEGGDIGFSSELVLKPQLHQGGERLVLRATAKEHEEVPGTCFSLGDVVEIDDDGFIKIVTVMEFISNGDDPTLIVKPKRGDGFSIKASKCKFHRSPRIGATSKMPEIVI